MRARPLSAAGRSARPEAAREGILPGSTHAGARRVLPWFLRPARSRAGARRSGRSAPRPGRPGDDTPLGLLQGEQEGCSDDHAHECADCSAPAAAVPRRAPRPRGRPARRTVRMWPAPVAASRDHLAVLLVLVHRADAGPERRRARGHRRGPSPGPGRRRHRPRGRGAGRPGAGVRTPPRPPPARTDPAGLACYAALARESPALPAAARGPRVARSHAPGPRRRGLRALRHRPAAPRPQRPRPSRARARHLRAHARHGLPEHQRLPRPAGRRRAHALHRRLRRHGAVLRAVDDRRHRARLPLDDRQRGRVSRASRRRGARGVRRRLAVRPGRPGAAHELRPPRPVHAGRGPPRRRGGLRPAAAGARRRRRRRRE